MDFHYSKDVPPSPLAKRLKASLLPPNVTLEDLAARLVELDEVAGDATREHETRMAAIRAEREKVKAEYDALYAKHFG